MTDFTELYVSAGLRRAQVETMWQLFKNGPTWDGNLISKTDRSILHDMGLVDRAHGWNWLTSAGMRLAIDLGMGMDENKKRYRVLDGDPK